MKDIKIIVACHKPSVLPNNKLFYPVQVGSAIAARQLEGMAHDNLGEHISHKNATYCELTAQYWAWKNLQADYYGLCHYRRFLCFADVDAPKNVRKQYEAEAIDSYNLSRFGLENETEMRNIIEKNDVVVGELQDISKLYTPRGNQKTAYKHWTAHDRALIKIHDLERMLDILSRVSPDVAKSTREYLNGDKFGGFNCFVMKKELFDEMCAIEFKVLEELEKVVDLSTYCQQIKRIYGFMGEIISSGYVYHLEQQKKYKVKHTPLVYFNYTDKLPSYASAPSFNTISVFFDQTTEMNFMFGTVLQSFLEHVDGNFQYDTYVAIRNLTPNLKQIYMDMAKKYSNVSLSFISIELFENMMTDRGKKVVNLMPFLPWLFPEVNKITVFGPNILFKKSIVDLWLQDIENKPAAAPADILMRAKVNDIYEETAEKYLSKQMRNPLNYFSTNAVIINTEYIRNHYTEAEIYECSWNNDNHLRSSTETLNVLLEGKVEIISQQWNTMYESNDYLKYQLPYAPNDDYMQLLSARKNPYIVSYMPNDPWIPAVNEVDVEFWEIARHLPLYHKYLAHMSYMVAPGDKDNRKMIDKIFPHNSSIRGWMIKLLPNGSLRRKFAKKILHLLKLQ